MNTFENLVYNLQLFFNECFLMFDEFMEFVENDDSKVMITFVVAFPLLFLGVWIIKKIIRVRDS